MSIKASTSKLRDISHPAEIPNLAGVYIADGFAYAVVGNGTRPDIGKGYSHFKVTPSTDTKASLARKFRIKNKDSVLGDLDEICRWIMDLAPNLAGIVVGCYGPFVSLDSGSEKYGLLGTTSHGELSNVNLKEKFEHFLTNHGADPKVQIYFDTDVAVNAVGYIYLKSKSMSGDEKKAMNDKTIAVINVDRGIGGTFIRFRNLMDWKGDLHPEFGQICVRKWKNEWDDKAISEFCENSRYSESFKYPHSIEALASIPAIETYLNKQFSQLKSNSSHWVWDREAWYLAQLAWTLTCFICPSHVVFYGEVMTTPGLGRKIRRTFDEIKESRTPINNNIESTPYYLEMSDSRTYLSFSLFPEIEEKYLVHEVGSVGAVGALCIAVHRVKTSPDTTKAPVTKLRSKSTESVDKYIDEY